MILLTSRALAALLLFALAATLAAPPAAADVGELRAEASVHAGGSRLTGDAVAFFLVDEVVDPEALPAVSPATASDEPVLGIDVDAGQLEAMVFERHQIVSAQDLVFQADPRHPTQPPTRQVLERAKGQLVAQQDKFQVTVLPADPAAAVPFSAKAQAGRMEPVDSLHMGPGRFRHAIAGDVDDRDPQVYDFWNVRIDAPLVVHEDEVGQMDVTFTGDLIIEVLGASLQLRGQDGDLTLETGVWRDPGLGTGAPIDQPAASAQRTVFARILLMDAKVRITVQGGSPGLYVAAPAMDSDNDGQVTLLGAVGRVGVGDEVRELDGDRYVAPPAHHIQVGRDGDLLAVSLAPMSQGPTPAGQALFPATASSLLVGVGAVLALAMAVALGLARRITHTPELAQVEAAIEAQRYGQAARLAKRILRAQPASEDAMLGRAIALSKDGRAGRAIAEIHSHLAKRDASDGALHYVLGLAFLDLGREDDARAALGEAVRRTPALQADVVSRLGQQTSSAPQPTSAREVHGYA